MKEIKEKEDRTKSVGVVVLKSDEVLLVEHKEGARHLTGIWGFPAGRLNEGETYKEAAVRELEEETGLKTAQDSMVDFRNGEPYISELVLKSGPEKFIFLVYLCTHYDGELREAEETRPQWVKISELHNLNVLPNIVEAVEEARKYLKQ